MIIPLFSINRSFSEANMNILKAIGGLFVRLWRWIKETAWVQPLLIVGAIFAVIFSIPHITEWVGSLGIGSASAYYTDFKLTLEKENTVANEFPSAADQLTKALWDNSNLSNNSEHPVVETYAEYKANLDASGVLTEYGEKFFLFYVGKDCSNCDAIQPGVKALQDDWKARFIPTDGRNFKLFTIFADDESTNDEDYENEEEKAFVRYLDKFFDLGYWFEIGGRLTDQTPYKTNASVSDTDYENLANADHDGFATPTILLIDFSKEAFELGRPGVSEVLFGVTGSDKFAKAKLLMNMWNHTDVDDITNPFVENYSK